LLAVNREKGGRHFAELARPMLSRLTSQCLSYALKRADGVIERKT